MEREVGGREMIILIRRNRHRDARKSVKTQ